MKTFRLLFIVLFAALISSCSHTNELANYDLRGKTVLYKEKVGPLAKQIQIETVSESNNKSDEKKSTAVSILETVASIGADLVSEEAKTKLQKNIHTDEMVEYITYGLKDALHTYLEINEVETVSDKPDFICNVVLEKIELRVSNSYTSVYVSALGTIIDRATGKIIWENREVATKPVKSGDADNKNSKLMEDALNILQLTSLDPEELNKIIGATVDDAGYAMGELLRNDISELNSK